MSRRSHHSLITKIASIFLFLAIVITLYKSWTSTRALNQMTPSGKWIASQGNERLHIICDDEEHTQGCVLHTQDKSPRHLLLNSVSPLTDGGWFGLGSLENESVSLFLFKETLLFQYFESSSSDTFVREKSSHSLSSAIRAKAKYLVALFLLIGASKWVQVVFIGDNRKKRRGRRLHFN